MGPQFAQHPRASDCISIETYIPAPSYHNESHPAKRRRVSLPHIRIGQTVLPFARDALSADPRQDVQRTYIENASAVPDSHNKRIIVPNGIGSRNRNDLNPSVNSRAEFIQESFAFPKQQIWLKTKPRQRRMAVRSEKETESSQSQSSDQSVASPSIRHTTHITALIARKHRENESNSLRERLALQQRLHRGELDVKDQVIAASHNELRRKMELSAKGIFNEKLPHGVQLGIEAKQKSFIETEYGHVALDQAGSEHGGITSSDSTEENANAELPGEAHDSDASSSAESLVGSSEYNALSEINNETVPVVIEPGNLSFIATQTVYQAARNTKSTTATLTDYPRSQAFHPAGPSILEHTPYDHQPQVITNSISVSQDWTNHIWHALPSTATPILAQSSIVLPSSHTPQQSLMPHTNVRVVNADANVAPSTTTSYVQEKDGCMPFVPNAEAATLEPSFLMNRANTNIFTGKAREDMLIGNSKLYAEPEKRRNMFSARS